MTAVVRSLAEERAASETIGSSHKRSAALTAKASAVRRLASASDRSFKTLPQLINGDAVHDSLPRLAAIERADPAVLRNGAEVSQDFARAGLRRSRCALRVIGAGSA
jgi:hypothetical protein